MEEKIQGKTVFRIHDRGKDTLNTGSAGVIKYDIEPDYTYYNRVKIRIPQITFEVPIDTILEIPVKIENPTSRDIDFSKHSKGELSIQYCLFKYGVVQKYWLATEKFPVQKLKAGESVDIKVKIRTPPEHGKHWRFRLAINTRGFFGRNSNSTLFKTIDWQLIK